MKTTTVMESEPSALVDEASSDRLTHPLTQVVLASFDAGQHH
jgi:hypothetical protein